MSADKHIVNIWDASTAQNMTSLQPQEPGINDVLHWKGSGLIMLGLDSPRIQVVPLPGHRFLITTGSRFYSILPSTCSHCLNKLKLPSLLKVFVLRHLIARVTVSS